MAHPAPTPTPATPPGPDSPVDTDLLRALLAAPAPLRRFPPALDAEFHAHMLEQGLRLTRDSLWALLLVTPAVCLLLRLLLAHVSAPEYLAGNLAAFDQAVLGQLLVVTLIALTPWLPAVRERYAFYVTLTSGGAVAIMIVVTSAIPEPYLRSFAAQITSVIILLVYALGVVSVRMATCAALCGVAAGSLVVWARGLWFDPGYFAIYAVLPNAVGLLVAVLIAIRDRVSFLQGKLLAAEKIRVDRYAQEVERLSRQDALTGLANRRHFNAALETEFARACRQRSPIAAIFVDIDYFKPFNDTHGHAEGDRVLAEVAQVIGAAARRPGDVAARYGGEEFVLLLPDTPLAGAVEIATDLRRALAARAIPHGASAVADRVTASMGIAAWVPGPGDDGGALLAAADGALYAAKAAGRDRVESAPAPR